MYIYLCVGKIKLQMKRVALFPPFFKIYIPVIARGISSRDDSRIENEDAIAGDNGDIWASSGSWLTTRCQVRGATFAASMPNRFAQSHSLACPAVSALARSYVHAVIRHKSQGNVTAVGKNFTVAHAGIREINDQRNIPYRVSAILGVLLRSKNA